MRLYGLGDVALTGDDLSTVNAEILAICQLSIIKPLYSEERKNTNPIDFKRKIDRSEGCVYNDLQSCWLDLVKNCHGR